MKGMKMTQVLDKETTMTDRYITKFEYFTLKKEWTKALQNKHEPKSWEFVLYNLLREKPLDRGFTKKRKNIQGNHTWFGLFRALDDALFQTNPMRQRPLTEFYGVTLPKGFRDKLLHERDVKREDRTIPE
jgi:hypothetical protein